MRSIQVTPLKMSKLKSKTETASHLTRRAWFLWANSWRMAAFSQTIISRKSSSCTWCFVFGVASLSPPSASSPRSTAATRQSVESVKPACIPVLSTAARSGATPTTYSPRRSKKASPPPSQPTRQPSSQTPRPRGLNKVFLSLTRKIKI